MAGIRWIQLDVNDHLHGTGRRIVGTKTIREWADLGRYDVLKDLCAIDERGYLDLSSPAEMRALRDELRLGANALCDFLDRMAMVGAIDADSWTERSRVLVAEAWNARQKYESKCRVNRANGKRGGRPRQQTRAAGGGNPIGFALVAQQKPNTNPVGFHSETQHEPTSF